MSQEQQAVTPTATNSTSIFRQERAGVVTSRVLYLLIGVGIALILLCIECILWILNPAHIFGGGSPHNLSTLLAILVHTPLLLLIPLLELLVVCTLAELACKPLAILSYIREAQRSAEQYRKLFTPLPTWNAIYKTNVTFYQDTPDPSVSNQPRNITISDLPQQRHTHLLLLGARGTGKTTTLHMYQHISLQKRSALMFGRDTLPIYIPLNRYSLFLQAIVEANPDELVGDGALLDFLYNNDLPGMHRLRPYLKRLIARGRVLFLCDGLDEVDQEYMPIVNAELAHLMSQQQNRLVLTGSEAHFYRQQELVQAANENLAARAILLPLDQAQIRSFIEQYIDSGAAIVNSPPADRRYTAGQIMDVITHNPAGYQFSTPMLLFILLEIIDEIGTERAKRLNTRGRILQEFVTYLIRHPSRTSEQRQEMPVEKELLLFCGELASAARYTHNAGVIQIPLARTRQGNREHIQEIAASLQSWLDSGELAAAGTQHRPNNRIVLVNLLLAARNAALIDISPGGIIGFRHPLIAAYLTGEYLMNVMGMPGASHETGWMANEALIRHMLTEIENWAEPVTMWAGLLDDPFILAKRFIGDGQDRSADRIEGLAMSLLCVGVVCAQTENSGQVVMPQSMEKAVAEALLDTQFRTKLAQLFTLCAGSGAGEIYQSLFSMLMIDGIDEFVPLLDPIVVPGLLFKQLCDIVDNGAYDQQVKRLVRVLGHCGASAVPRATELTSAATGRSMRLRSAAINILGGTNEQSAVAPFRTAWAIRISL